MPASNLRRRGIRAEPDGTLVLDRRHLAAPPAEVAASPEGGRVHYPLANVALAATLANPGVIHAYEPYGVGPILTPGAWRLTLALDGEPLLGPPPRTAVRGRKMVETWAQEPCTFVIHSYCDAWQNVLYQAFHLAGHDGRPHVLEATVRATFLVDEETGAYGLHYDEPLGAIVAIMSETLLPEPTAAQGAPGQALPARVALVGATLPPSEWRVSDQHAYLTYRLEAPAGEEASFCLALTGGVGRPEHETLYQNAIRDWRRVLAQTEEHNAWLAERLEIGDPVLHGLFVAGLNAAESAYREAQAGAQSGLLPGADAGALTRPVDAYWCAQALLPWRPEHVRAEIRALAPAVHSDGGLAGTVRLAPGAGAGPERYDLGPLSCDAPSYFAMLVHDYVAWTGDQAILDEEGEDGRSVWHKALAGVDFLRRLDVNHDYLIERPRDMPDWAVDVRRDDWVTYDLALHVQACKCVAELALLRGEDETGRDLATWAVGAQGAINRRMWNEPNGYYVDYIRSYMGFVEDHTALDTVVAVLFGVASESQSHRHLARLQAVLETHNNEEQYYGDWGVMNCYPFYKERHDLAGRSTWAYSGANGGAWPGWSGVYALAKLLHHLPDWRYALDRWFTYGLGQYWFTPRQWYAPPYEAQGLLYSQGAMPAAAMVLGGFGVWPNVAGEVVLRVPPWGDSRVNGVRLRGETYDVQAVGRNVTLWLHGEPVTTGEHGLRIRLGAVPERAV
jgi:hypothetical protein